MRKVTNSYKILQAGNLLIRLSFFVLVLAAYVWPATGQEIQTAPARKHIAINKTPILTIEGAYQHFEVDRLGNLFLISAQGNQIKEYNAKGDSINRYDNTRSYGPITSIDVSNPLKIAVFYSDFSTIVVLDRYLSPVNTIDLRKAGIWEARAIATSYDNLYWVYDQQEAKIKKVDGQGEVRFASSDMRQVFDREVNPEKLFDQDGLLYTYDASYGWYVFDYYGALNQKVPVKGLLDPLVEQSVLTGRVAGKIWLLPAARATLSNPVWQPLPISGTIRQTKFDPASGKLWVLTDTGLSVYPLVAHP